jgi:hypothetical protein
MENLWNVARCFSPSRKIESLGRIFEARRLIWERACEPLRIDDMALASPAPSRSSRSTGEFNAFSAMADVILEKSFSADHPGLGISIVGRFPTVLGKCGLTLRPARWRCSN